MRCLPWLAFLLAISNLIPLYSSTEISPYAVIITIPGTTMRINNRNTYLRKKESCTARRINTFQYAFTSYSIMFLMLRLTVCKQHDSCIEESCSFCNFKLWSAHQNLCYGGWECQFVLPWLLDDVTGPDVAAHVARAVVVAAVGHERAGDWVRHHEQEGEQPCGADHLGGVRFGLPRTRC